LVKYLVFFGLGGKRKLLARYANLEMCRGNR